MLWVSYVYRSGVCGFDGVKILGVNLYMRILVTGGAGFIGSHLVERLEKLGHDVMVLDLKGNPIIDICDKEDIDYLFNSFKPELVFHLAANTDVPLSVVDPLFDFRSLVGALNILDKKVPTVIVSSSFVYGNAVNLPTTEKEPFEVSAPYGIVKHTMEQYAQFYNEVYGVRNVIVRPATVYGPRQVKGAMADYIRKIRNLESAVIYGQKTRDYVYVDDVVDALILLMDKEGTYNIGTGKETTLERLYFEIANVVGVKNEPILLPGRPGEIDFQSLDCTKLEKLGWKPKVGLIEGLKRTIDAKRIT